MQPRDALRWMFLLCDGWILVRFGWGSIRQACRNLAAAADWPGFVLGIEALRLVLVLSLFVGIWLLARQRPGLRRLVWLQLPARIFFGALGEPVYLSCTFLRPVVLWSGDGRVNPLGVLGLLAALEILRALLSLLLKPRAPPTPPGAPLPPTPPAA